jgi:hypothetical protein
MKLLLTHQNKWHGLIIMRKRLRLSLKKIHNITDVMVGKVLGGKSLGRLSAACAEKMPLHENIDSFAYAKKSHF